MMRFNFLLAAATFLLAAADTTEYAAVEVSPGAALMQVRTQKTKDVPKAQHSQELLQEHEEDLHLDLHSLVLDGSKNQRTEQIAKSQRLDSLEKMFLEHNKAEVQPSCPLPVNATWCQVRLNGLEPYMMAVRAGLDVVSNQVCQKGFWETQDFSTYGAPGKAMDIGGNMGYFTFALASAGWTVTTFEPMKANLDLMAATLCANPNFVEKVDIHPHGLGATNTHCRFVFHKGNIGNGITRCQEDTNMWWEDIDKDFRYGEEEYQLRKFDEVINELQAQGKLQTIDFVKIDVEGYECEVMKGAPDFLNRFAPRLVKTEVWPHLERCEPSEYLSRFVNAGYVLARDAACTQLAPDLARAGGDYFICRK